MSRPPPRREVAIWWPLGHSTDEFCLAFPVLGYVAFFSPNELVVTIRMILSLKHPHTHTHTKSVVLSSLDKSEDLAPLGPPSRPANNGLEPSLSTGRVLSGSPQSPPLPPDSPTMRQKAVAFGTGLARLVSPG